MTLALLSRNNVGSEYQFLCYTRRVKHHTLAQINEVKEGNVGKTLIIKGHESGVPVASFGCPTDRTDCHVATELSCQHIFSRIFLKLSYYQRTTKLHLTERHRPHFKSFNPNFGNWQQFWQTRFNSERPEYAISIWSEIYATHFMYFHVLRTCAHISISAF